MCGHVSTRGVCGHTEARAALSFFHGRWFKRGLLFFSGRPFRCTMSVSGSHLHDHIVGLLRKVGRAIGKAIAVL